MTLLPLSEDYTMDAHVDPNRRPYVGRYVSEATPRPNKLTRNERIELLLQAAHLARTTANEFTREGLPNMASAAFHRAHTYIEMVRELRSHDAD